VRVNEDVARRWSAFLAAAVVFGAAGLVLGWRGAWALHYEGLARFMFVVLASATLLLLGAGALVMRTTRLFGVAVLLGLVCFHVGYSIGVYLGRL
jgi:hypothetical protein